MHLGILRTNATIVQSRSQPNKPGLLLDSVNKKQLTNNQVMIPIPLKGVATALTSSITNQTTHNISLQEHKQEK